MYNKCKHNVFTHNFAWKKRHKQMFRLPSIIFLIPVSFISNMRNLDSEHKLSVCVSHKYLAVFQIIRSRKDMPADVCHGWGQLANILIFVTHTICFKLVRILIDAGYTIYHCVPKRSQLFNIYCISHIYEPSLYVVSLVKRLLYFEYFGI
jgi:hypothetical protein